MEDFAQKYSNYMTAMMNLKMENMIPELPDLDSYRELAELKAKLAGEEVSRRVKKDVMSSALGGHDYGGMYDLFPTRRRRIRRSPATRKYKLIRRKSRYVPLSRR